MGCIISPSEAIERTRFSELRKGRVVKASRVLRLDDRAFLIELGNGEITVVGRRHGPNGNCALLGYGRDDFSGAVLDGLVSFGIITRDEVREHKAAITRADRKRLIHDAKKRLQRACEDLGIPTPEVHTEEGGAA